MEIYYTSRGSGVDSETVEAYLKEDVDTLLKEIRAFLKDEKEQELGFRVVRTLSKIQEIIA